MNLSAPQKLRHHRHTSHSNTDAGDEMVHPLPGRVHSCHLRQDSWHVAGGSCLAQTSWQVACVV